MHIFREIEYGVRERIVIVGKPRMNVALRLRFLFLFPKKLNGNYEYNKQETWPSQTDRASAAHTIRRRHL